MNRWSLVLCLLLCFGVGLSQENREGNVTDAASGEPISNVTVCYFIRGKKFGLITNAEGQFTLPQQNPDSIRLSSIGYASKLLLPPFRSIKTITLSRAVVAMETVVVRPLSAEEILQKAIARLPQTNPSGDFENLAFYREIIKDRENYFSVSEALVKAQYFPKKKDFRLALEQGRAKEDVAYTRLFEDYHPGGGPQLMAAQAFVVEIPDCLQLSKTSHFVYKKDSLTFLDGHRLYVISFDQKDGIKEALEKGKIYIDAEDFSVVSYAAATSPKGKDYIKSLTGSDKIMAKILGIDFDVHGWSRKLFFSRVDSFTYLSFASYTRAFLYKQPKKGVDLDLTMSFEWMVSDPGLPVIEKIKDEEAWKRANLMVNLPTAFDSSFWNEELVISPTDSLKAILRAIAVRNGEGSPGKSIEGWQFFNRKFFVATPKEDGIALIPTMKCSWENEETGPLLFKESSGNFTLESNLQVVKSSNVSEPPDKGFQQGGLMIRTDALGTENNFFIALGTAGNPNPKLFFKKTEAGKTKTVVSKAKNLTVRLRIEKKEDEVKAFIKWDKTNDWEIVGNYKASWLKGSLQIGMAAFTDFVGNGPKMHPDATFLFSKLEFKN